MDTGDGSDGGKTWHRSFGGSVQTHLGWLHTTAEALEQDRGADASQASKPAQSVYHLPSL